MNTNQSFLISPKAAVKIGNLLKTEAEGSMFRVAVNGGGCSGFQYEFTTDAVLNEDDILIKMGDAKVVIDETSMPFLENATLDWVDELIGSAFKIKNPNAKSSCGCGVSFSI